MYWDFVLMIFLSQGVLVVLLCLWAAFFLVVLLPRLRPQQDSPPGVKALKDTGKYLTGASSASWSELRAWVKAQPAKTIYKADVDGFMAALEQAEQGNGEIHDAPTQVVNWGGKS